MINIINDSKSKMEKSIVALKSELAKVRTGRASLSMLDGIMVECYGSCSPLNQVATLSVADPKLITIQPWDASVISSIEKAILKSQLGLSPANDGKLIRLPIPALTEDRRKEFVKMIKKYGEEARVSIRNARRDGNDYVKKHASDEGISEDDVKMTTEKIQKITDDYIKQVDSILEDKEKDIMTV